MTATVEEVDLSVFEDLAAPCDYQEHDLVGTGPAAWVWTLRNPGTCGCKRPMSIVLICEGCWDYLNNDENVHCTFCSAPLSISAETISVVRI